VTGDELIRHRLHQLEEWRVESSATVQSTARAVDIQKIESATVKGLLIELRTEVRDRDEHTRNSLARLHERLDEITTAESFEKGREAGTRDSSSKTWKVIGWTVMAVIAFMAVVVATLSLILH
jgi:hypothetical protein